MNQKIDMRINEQFGKALRLLSKELAKNGQLLVSVFVFQPEVPNQVESPMIGGRLKLSWQPLVSEESKRELRCKMIEVIKKDSEGK